MTKEEKLDFMEALIINNIELLENKMLITPPTADASPLMHELMQAYEKGELGVLQRLLRIIKSK